MKWILVFIKTTIHISLLRIEASKLGYFNSPSVNVPSYKIDEVNTSEREDIKRFDLKIKTKPVYNLTVKVEDAGNKSAVIANAIISVDGIKTAQNLAESESVSKIQGSSATFQNVIGGAGSNRIIRVEVPGSNYIPVIKTINNFSSDRTITISLKDSNEQPTRLATTSVLDYAVDMETGKAKVSIETFDKLTDNGQTADLKSLTSSAEIVAYVNGKQVKFAKTALTDTKLDIFLPLEIGLNEVYFEVANQLGISRSSSAIIKYNPNIGNIAGTIRDFNLSAYPDSTVLIDIYTFDDLYINTVTASINKDGKAEAEYVLENLKAKENYKLVAMFLDKEGKLKGYSEQIPVTVPSAQTAKIDLSVEMLVGESAVSGAPLFDTVGELNSIVANSDGRIYINATVSNFDFDGDGSLYYVVNDVMHDFNISKEANYFTKVTGTEHTYVLANYPVQLDKGVNNFYLIAINPNYAYDWSRDTQIKWIPTGETLKTLTVELNGCDEDKNQTRETCSVIDNAYVSLYTTKYQLIATKMTNNEGKAEFSDLVANNYIVYPDLELGEQYNLKAISIDLTATGSIDLNLSVFDSSAISVPDFEIYDINETLVTKGHYTLTPDLSDYNYTNAKYEWFDSYYDENNTYMPNVLLSTTRSTNWIPTATGNHEITFNIDVNGSKNSYTKEIYVDETNTSNRVLPQAPEVPSL